MRDLLVLTASAKLRKPVGKQKPKKPMKFSDQLDFLTGAVFPSIGKTVVSSPRPVSVSAFPVVDTCGSFALPASNGDCPEVTPSSLSGDAWETAALFVIRQRENEKTWREVGAFLQNQAARSDAVSMGGEAASGAAARSAPVGNHGDNLNSATVGVRES